MTSIDASRSLTPMIYIAGGGRSGSTLLDRILTTSPGIVSVGELRYIWTASMRHDEKCGCGDPFSECDFWASVVSLAGIAASDGDVMARALPMVERRRLFPLDLVREVLRRRAAVGRVTDVHYPGAADQVSGKNHLAIRDRYDSGLRRLTDAVMAKTGCRALVNSSKSPTHAVALARALGRPFHVVHLVRDSRAVAFSWSKTVRDPGKARLDAVMPRYGTSRVAQQWSLENLMCESLRAIATSYQQLRYEDLVRHPRDVAVRVLRQAGLGRSDVAIRGGAVSFGIDHTVHGNPIRFLLGEHPIREDRKWVDQMAGADAAFVTAATWPLLLRYGYSLSRK